MLQKSNICQYRPLTFLKKCNFQPKSVIIQRSNNILYSDKQKSPVLSNHSGNGNERFARTKCNRLLFSPYRRLTSASSASISGVLHRSMPTQAHKLPQVQNRKKQKNKAPNFAQSRAIRGFLAESKGFEPSNTRLDVTRFPIVLLRPARTTLHIQRALGASAYSLLIQDLVVRGELIQLFLKLILGLLLRGGDGIMAGEATVAKIESGLLRKFVSRFYTKIPQAVNP